MLRRFRKHDAGRWRALALSALLLVGACFPPENPDDATPLVMTTMEKNRSGDWQGAFDAANAYFGSPAGKIRSGERCALLVSSAYSAARLDLSLTALTRLDEFDQKCMVYAMPSGWRDEAGRIRRFIRGEPVASIWRRPAEADSGNAHP